VALRWCMPRGHTGGVCLARYGSPSLVRSVRLLILMDFRADTHVLCDARRESRVTASSRCTLVPNAGI